MKCPWPVLRAAKALRDCVAIEIRADDPIAGGELAALAEQRGWDFVDLGEDCYRLSKS